MSPSDEAQTTPVGRQLPRRLYLWVLFLIIVLPPAGYGVARWLAGVKRDVDRAFTEPAWEFLGPERIAWNLAFSPDGRQVLSGGNGGATRLWDVETGQCLRTMPGPGKFVGPVAFGPDGRRIFSWNPDETIQIWDAETGKCLRTVELEGSPVRFRTKAFSPDRRLLLTGSEAGKLRLWELETGRCRRTLREKGGEIWSVAFTADGRRCLSGEKNDLIQLWEVETGERLRTTQIQPSGYVHVLAFSPDGSQALTGGTEDNSHRLWDLETGKCLRIWREHKALIWSGAFSPAGRRGLSASEDETIRIWDLETGEELGRFARKISLFRTVIFSPDGRHVLSGGWIPAVPGEADHDGELFLWRVPTDRQLQIWRLLGGKLPEAGEIRRLRRARP